MVVFNNGLCKSVHNTDGYVCYQEIEKPIGKIIEKHSQDDKSFFVVKIDDDFGSVFLTEEGLKELTHIPNKTEILKRKQV